MATTQKYFYPPRPGSGLNTFSDNIVGLQLTDGGGLTQGNFEFTTAVTEKVNRNFNIGAFSAPISLEDMDVDKVIESRIIFYQGENISDYENKFNDAKSYVYNNRLNSLDVNDAETALSGLNSIKYKSPTLATISSIIIPGSGYIYAGHTVTGISALIFNSLLAYATYTSFKSNNTGMGVLTGLIGMGFYISNIQGSAKSVIRYNNYKKQQVIKGFERKINLNN